MQMRPVSGLWAKPEARQWAIAKAKIWGQVLLAMVSSYYVVSMLLRGFQTIRFSGIGINLALLGLSFALTIVCVFLGALQWVLLLRASGGQIGTRAGMRVHLLSIIPKYLPGVGWQYLSKVVLSERSGISREKAITCTICEFGCNLAGGSMVALLFLPISGISTLIPANLNSATILWPAFLVAFLASPRVVQEILDHRLIARFLRVRIQMHYLPMLALIALMAFTWTLFGIAFFFLATSLQTAAISEVPRYVLILTVSFLASLIAFMVPLGIGVREGVMTFLLSALMPSPYAALVAILSRITLITAELASVSVGTRL